VAGVGGVGGYLGGKLIQAGLQPDTEISFIARGRHLEEIRRHGLILNTLQQKNLVCKPDVVTDRVSDVPAPDLCLVYAKGYDLAPSASNYNR
jgi:2-dehydropantoate 2-reductase